MISSEAVHTEKTKADSTGVNIHIFMYQCLSICSYNNNNQGRKVYQFEYVSHMQVGGGAIGSKGKWGNYVIIF